MIVKNYNGYIVKNIDTFHGEQVAVSDRGNLINHLKNTESPIYVKSFWVDKGHRNGPEIHQIYSNGLIEIFNFKTKKYITSLIGRPQQIKRYWEAIGSVAPTNVVKLAREHQKAGYNEV